MTPLLAILGVKLQMIEDAEAVKRYGSRLAQRNESYVHSATVQFMFSGRHMKKIQRKGGTNSRAYMSARRARALARRAARARWAKQQNGHGPSPIGVAP